MDALLSTETTTSGGDRDSDMTALAVMPQSWPSQEVVTTVTPVAKRPMICRCS